jgi:cell division transport system permease protein
MRLLRRSLRGLTRHARLWALTLASVALTFLVVATLALIHDNLQRAVTGWQERFRLSAALEPGLSDDRLAELGGQLRALPGVSGVDYVDSAAALEELERRLGPQEQLLSLLPGNPLPGTFRLRVRAEALEPARLRAMAERVRALPGVAEVRWGETWAARFFGFFRLFGLVAAACAVLLFAAAAFIISSQIRLALALRREELAILDLLGASSAFIRGPYVIEGALVGTGGAALAAAVCFGLYRLFLSQAGTGLESLLAQTRFLPAESVAALIGFGAVVGMAGSLVSVRRLTR